MDTVPCPAASGGQTPQSWHHGWGKTGICPPVHAGICPPVLPSAGCCDTPWNQEGRTVQLPARLPAAQEIKLSWIQSSPSITLSSCLKSNNFSEGWRQIMNSPDWGCLFECFSLPLTTASPSHACSGSLRNTISVCLRLPKGVKKREKVFLLVERGPEEFSHILMPSLCVLSFRNSINLYTRLHWNTWVPFSPAKGGDPTMCQTPNSGRCFSPAPHWKAVTSVGRKTSPSWSKRLRLQRPLWKEETMPVCAAACFLSEHLLLLK